MQTVSGLPVRRPLHPHQVTVVSLSKKLSTQCLVLVDFRNRFEHDLISRINFHHYST